MYGKTNAIASYGRVANAENDPVRQVVMLYDGAIKFLRLAASGIEAGDIAAKARYTDRALQVVNHLQSTLDFEHGGEVAITLNALYVSVTLMALRASSSLDATAMRHAADLLAPVRDAWDVNARTASLSAADAVVPAHAPATPSYSVSA